MNDEIELISETLVLNQDRPLREQATAVHLALHSGAPVRLPEDGAQ